MPRFLDPDLPFEIGMGVVEVVSICWTAAVVGTGGTAVAVEGSKEKLVGVSGFGAEPEII